MNFSSLPAELPPIVDPAAHYEQLIVVGVGALAASTCIIAGAVGVCRIISSKYRNEKDQTNVH